MEAASSFLIYANCINVCVSVKLRTFFVLFFVFEMALGCTAKPHVARLSVVSCVI